MQRGNLSKQLQARKYLRDRNLLVSSATLQLTESIKRKARRTQEKENAKRASRTQLPFVSNNRSTQTDSNNFTVSNTNSSDIFTDDLIFVPIDNTSRYCIIARTVSFCLKLFFIFLSGILICTLFGYFLRRYLLDSRL